jgi:hypothetical protein
MNPEVTPKDLLYPTEWIFRFFIAAVLIRIASPDWAYAFPYLADSVILPLSFYLLVIAAAGAFVVQVRVAMRYISSRRQNVPQHQ